jgi:hypothetical protein
MDTNVAVVWKLVLPQVHTRHIRTGTRLVLPHVISVRSGRVGSLISESAPAYQIQDEIKIFKKKYGYSTTRGRSLATERVTITTITTTTGHLCLCYVVNSRNLGGGGGWETRAPETCAFL